MNVRPPYVLAIAAALILLLAASFAPRSAFTPRSEAAQQPAQPSGGVPNVVLIVADDMRADSLWVMSSLGTLAERGVTFSRAFVTTPVCCPSRASIMTGLYARHHGALTNNPPLGGIEKFDERSTLATWASLAGLRTGLIGRYLNGYASTAIPPGWDYWFALWQVNEDYSNYYDYRVTDSSGERRYFGAKPEMYSTRMIGQHAQRFIEEDRTRPFLLMLTPRTPHYPATPDPVDSGTFKDLDLPLPPSYDEADLNDKPRWVLEFGPMGEKKRERLETFRRRQLESLLSLDRVIGTLVESLRADGRLNNTWIIFTSDNGLTLGEHRLDLGKGCAYEECIRVPLVVVPPGGLAERRVDDRLVANIDLAPTIADIMGVAPGAAVDGHSLLPLLDGSAASWRDGLVLEQWSETDWKGFVGIRTENRKYVRHATSEEELYDELADPYELQNLAKSPDWAAEKTRLAEQLDTLLATPAGQVAAAQR